MNIAVLGLGYVGCVSAACLARRGHAVVGVDTQDAKVSLLNQGRATIVEDEIGDLVADVVASGRLSATTSLEDAARRSEMFLVCVGTPSRPNGSLSTVAVQRVAEDLGRLLRERDDRVTIVFRSTMLPGTCMDLLVPILERASGKIAGADFGVAVNPEYLREGSSIHDFDHPPKTVIGQLDEESGEALARLYRDLPAEMFRVPIPVAEMTKYVDNTFHALKVGFANEIGAVCRALGVDVDTLIEMFMADTKLNISTAYLRPGFAFGGSCLPKDLRGLVYAAQHADVGVPLLSSILPSNETHMMRTLDEILKVDGRRIGMLGLAFKSGTDDLRESPLVELAERLLGKGFELQIFDGNVVLSRLLGANREYIEQRVPHLGRLLRTAPDDVTATCDAVVVGTRDEECVAAVRRAHRDVTIIDVVGLRDIEIVERPRYVRLV